MTEAQRITIGLRGTWHARYGAAPCPICQPDGRKGQNALTLADAPGGRILLHCKKAGCSFTDIARSLGLAPGDFARPDPAELARLAEEARREADKRARRARAIWDAALPVCGTIADTYLRSRGITCDLPDTLRFHPESWHPTARRLPAMVAKVEGAERFALHRTWLAPDGRGKAAIDPAKAMLGATLGGAVRLTAVPGPLVVAEGIETGLSLASGLLRGPATIWAALSASGMAGLRLPADPGRLTVATDGDTAGKDAGYRLAERATALGWTVRLLPAPDGRDWNDILAMKGATA